MHLKDDKEIVLAALREPLSGDSGKPYIPSSNGIAYSFASERLRDDEDVLRVALQVENTGRLDNVANLSLASERLRSDPALMLSLGADQEVNCPKYFS